MARNAANSAGAECGGRDAHFDCPPQTILGRFPFIVQNRLNFIGFGGIDLLLHQRIGGERVGVPENGCGIGVGFAVLRDIGGKVRLVVPLPQFDADVIGGRVAGTDRDAPFQIDQSLGEFVDRVAGQVARLFGSFDNADGDGGTDETVGGDSLWIKNRWGGVVHANGLPLFSL